MVQFISKPLAAYLHKSVQENMEKPLTSESLDIVAEAVSEALRTTFGASAVGKAALRTLALNLLDKTKAS